MYRLPNQSKENAMIGCLLGTAIGDAMGLSYEGLSKQRLVKLYPKLNQYHFLFGKGMVSDDTEQTCFVAQALIESHGNIVTFQKSLAWKLRFWLLGLPAGIGLATLKALCKLWLGFSPNNSGIFSAGNGAAMRSSIIGVCFGQNFDQLKSIVKASTRITHTDPKAEWGALAVALAASLSSQTPSPSPYEYLNQLEKLLKTEPAEEFLTLIKQTIDSVLSGQSSTDFAESLGLKNCITSYVYHTIPMVIHVWLTNPQDYQTAILNIIRCGGDTDTTAAIVGGIIGARVGKAGIPKPWLDNFWEYPRNINWIEKLAQRLHQVCYHQNPQKALQNSLLGILFRNLIFLLIVLWHGFRRLLPPY